MRPHLLRGSQPLPAIDGLIAATGLDRQLTLVTIRDDVSLWTSSTRQEQVEIEAEDVRRPRPGIEAQHPGALFPDRRPAWGPGVERGKQAPPGSVRRIAHRWV